MKTNTLAIIATAIILSACEGFIHVPPPNTELVTSTVYQDKITATSAITGIYSEMIGGSSFASGGSNSITVYAGLSADEFTDFTGGDNKAFEENSLTATNGSLKINLWDPGFRYIFYANTAIEGLTQSPIDTSLKEQLIGEAKFIRAFTYFYLANMFGDLPLILSTDYNVNKVADKISVSKIYDQIIADLNDAKKQLPKSYSGYNEERVRPIAATASALLARVYLYQRKWTLAEFEATIVINESNLFSILDDCNSVFLKNSNEAIWQLMPVVNGYNTWEGATFIIDSTASRPTFVSLKQDVIDDFDTNDLRKQNWINSATVTTGNIFYYSFKYKVPANTTEVTEYSTVIRLAEIFLIRAESRAEQSNVPGAIDDLDVIRKRAGIQLLKDTNPSISEIDLLLAVQDERRREFFAEWGHRWFDLKRTQTANATLTPKKTLWNSSDVLYPIPQPEISNNPNLLPQNEGY